MRILIPIFGFARAGGGRVLSNLATEWVKRGHQVSFLSPEGYEVYFPTEAEILWFNEKGELLEQPNKTAAPISYFKKVLALRKLIKEIASSYDLVLVNYAPTVIPAVLAGVKAKIFYYIQANETEYLLSHPGVGFKLKALATWLTYFLIPRARCIANSDIYINYKNIRTCSEIIAPGIDLSTYWTKKFSTLKGRTVVLGTIGRTESYKGTPDVISAYRLLRERGVDVSLRIAYGNAPEVLLAGLPDVEIIVPKNDSELSDFYRSVDVLIALGTVQLGAAHYPVIEAMACGTLVVTTGYYPAKADNAYIVPIGDTAACADAITAITQSNDTELITKINLGLEKTNVMTWPKLANKMLNYMERTL